MTPCCKVLAGPNADQVPSLDTSSPTKPMGCRRADLQLMCSGLCRWLNWMQLSPERAAQSKRKSGEGEKLVLCSGSGLGPGHLLCMFVQYTLFWPDLAFTIMAAKCGRAVMWREQAAAAGCSRAVMHRERCGFTAHHCWAVLSPGQSSRESPWQTKRGWFGGEISLAKRICKGWVPMGETQRFITLGKRAGGVSWLSSCSSLCLHHPSKPHVIGESTFPAHFAEGMEGQKG